ncbi:hypothetical protein [Paenarthrobacter nitroguajacolicus]
MNDEVNPLIPTVWEAAVLGVGAVAVLLVMAALVLVLSTKSFSPGVRIALVVLAFAAPVAGPLVGIVLALLERRKARRPNSVRP